MSFLDIDERILELADKIEMVYGPLVDAKEIPEDIDLFLISGSVSTDKELEEVREIRNNSRFVASFGDCAVTGNLPSMRNARGAEEALEHAYVTTVDDNGELPGQNIPHLLKRARPVHEVIQVDEFIQGCPPDADLIHLIVSEMVEGRMPRRGIRTTFG
jgi:NAD-reducing hydrogenase small subunit